MCIFNITASCQVITEMFLFAFQKDIYFFLLLSFQHSFRHWCGNIGLIIKMNKLCFQNPFKFE